ncbi:MAG: hypothetical protein V4437_01315 [Patescibacteria group bacterium]
MVQNRSIQDIIPPARSRPIRSATPGTSETPPPHQPVSQKPMSVSPRRPSGFFGFAVVAGVVAVLLVVVVIVISTVFYRAYVTVTPYSFNATIQSSFETSPSSESLPYQKITATDTVNKSVPATGSQHVDNHSSGTITIYNAYSATPQRLITNTRFATKDGLVFRVHAPVVVPGYTMKAGIKVPGVVDAVAYADDAGEKYNIPTSDFNIPGLKGSKQYTLIYAKSKAPMSGGFVGQQAVVDPAVRAQTIETLKADLERSLREKMLASAPPGTLIFADSFSIMYTEAPDTVDGSNAVITVGGSAVAPAVSEVALARTLASNAQISYQGPLSIKNPNDLHVQVDAPEALGSDTPIHLTVSGTAKLVATFDLSQLSKDLAGKDKKDIKSVLPSYPGISNIDVKIYPFWRGGIPSDSKALKITETDSSTN